MEYPNPLKWWAQSVLPLTFDDSLSYYEVLAKCTNYINNIIDDIDKIEEDISELDIDHLNEVIEQMEEIVENIPVDELESLISDVETLKTNLTTLQNTVDNLSSRLDDAQDDIRDFGTDLGNVEYDVNSLKNNRIGKVPQLRVSIIGDSISTYDQAGYKIDGYAMWYPRGNVDSVDKTWWHKVIENSGAELEVNASYSGSRATNTHATAPDFYQRTGSDVLGNPDIIIVALGTNDSSNDVALGEYDFNSDFNALSEATFRTAYIKGVKALQNNFPNAYIYCVCMSMNEAYRDSIIRICDELNVICLECDRYTIVSTVHPDSKGMEAIACEFTNSTDFSRCTEIVNNAKSSRTVMTPEQPEGFTISGVNVNQYGKIVIVEITGLNFSEASTAWRDLQTGLPLPINSTYFAELNPSSMSSETGTKTTCRARVLKTGVLQFARGLANTSYTGIIVYIAK